MASINSRIEGGAGQGFRNPMNGSRLTANLPRGGQVSLPAISAQPRNTGSKTGLLTGTKKAR